MKDPPQLRLKLKPSRLAAASIAAGVIATAVLVAWLPVDWLWRMAICLAVGAYGVWLLRSRAHAATVHSIVAVEVAVDLRGAFIERSGTRVEGRVQPESFVSAMLTTIVLRADGERRSRAVVILPDSLAAEDFRRLRVVLRLGRLPAEDAR